MKVKVHLQKIKNNRIPYEVLICFKVTHKTLHERCYYQLKTKRIEERRRQLTAGHLLSGSLGRPGTGGLRRQARESMLAATIVNCSSSALHRNTSPEDQARVAGGLGNWSEFLSIVEDFISDTESHATEPESSSSSESF